MRSSSRRLAALTASIAVAGLAAASSAGAAPPPHSQANLGKKPDFRLTLLHNNDGESKLATGSSVAGYGGAARFETVVERLRAEAAVAPVGRENRDKPKATGTLLVSSGDNFLAGLALLLGFQEGPPWPDAVVANALGYDAMTIGNHEFDFGQARLAEFIEGVDDDIPFISANLGFEGTLLEELADAGRIAPAAVVERDGERVGIIGLTTPDVTAISSPGNVTVDSDLATVVNGQVAALQARGVDKIVVSAHLQGIAADKALIPQVRGVDVWIAGGGDDLLASPGDTLIPGDVSVGAYPTAVTDADGKAVLVVSTAGEYKYVGRLTVDFDKAGEITAYDDAKSGPVRVSGTPTDPDYAEEDAFVKANAVDPVTEFSAGLASQPNGTTEVTLRRTATVAQRPDPPSRGGLRQPRRRLVPVEGAAAGARRRRRRAAGRPDQRRRHPRRHPGRADQQGADVRGAAVLQPDRRGRGHPVRRRSRRSSSGRTRRCPRSTGASATSPACASSSTRRGPRRR